MIKQLALAVSLAVVAGGAPFAQAEDAAKEKEFFTALDRRIVGKSRAEWDAYVAREGADMIAKGYYPFAAGACQKMKQGTTEKFILDNYTMFFGENAGPIVAAGREVICPEVIPK